MDIVLTWDPSVETMPADERTAFEGAVTYAADYFDRTITSPLSITINVGWGEISADGPPSSLPAGTSEGGPDDGVTYTYAQVESALRSHVTSPVTASAYAALPGSDPTGGEGFYVPSLEAAALGLPLYNGGAQSTGSVGFGAPFANEPYDFSTTDRNVPGEIDFVGTAEHEISHALGRLSEVGGGPNWNVPDLFRFTSQGVLASSPTQPAYFSVDGGRTALKYFDSTNSDAADWMSSGPNAVTGDSFSAYADQGQTDYVTSTDLNLMNVLGLTITPNTPRDDFKGNELSDVLVENTAGAVEVGEIGGAGQAVAYTAVAGLGPEWSFVGAGDFLGDGQSDFLIENTNGAVVVGEVTSGQAVFTVVGELGPEWRFVGSGDFLADGRSQFLIENTGGGIDIGEVKSGVTSYTPIGELGPEWSFVGTGDFLGQGDTQFLIENTSGAVEVGSVSGGAASYQGVGGLGPEWRFVGSGDFLGDGKFQFLIENTSGTVEVGEVTASGAKYAAIGGLGPEWHFVGAGDYAGSGTDSFLIENTSGAVETGTVVSGQAQYAAVSGLGPEWKFHG